MVVVVVVMLGFLAGTGVGGGGEGHVAGAGDGARGGGRLLASIVATVCSFDCPPEATADLEGREWVPGYG